LKTVASISLKGGVGKSSFVILCAMLLAERGKKVLVWDLDIQNSTTFRYDPELVLANEKNAARIFMEPGTLHENIVTVGDGVDLVPSSMNLAKFGTLPANTLKLILKKLRGVYDVVLIDTAPAWDAVVRSAFTAADILITPCEPSEFNQMNIAKMQEIYELEDDEKLERWHVIPTGFDLGMARHREILEKYRTNYGERITPFVVEACEDFPKLVEVRKVREWTGSFKRLMEQLNQVVDLIGGDDE